MLDYLQPEECCAATSKIAASTNGRVLGDVDRPGGHSPLG